MIYPIAEPTTADEARTEPLAQLARLVVPLRPRAVDRTAARVARTIGDTRLAALAHATLGIEDLRADLIEARGGQLSTPDAADPGVVELSIAMPTGTSRSTFHLALDLDAYPSLAIAAWPERNAPAASAGNGYVPQPAASMTSADIALRNAVAGVLLEPLLEHLARFGFKDPRVVSVQRRRLALAEPQRDLQRAKHAEPSVAPFVALSFTHRARRHAFTLLAEPPCYDALDALLRAGPAAAAAAAAAATRSAWQAWQPALLVPGRLIVGTKAIAVDTLAALEPGDVLLRGVFSSFDATLLSSAGAASEARPHAVAAWGTPGLTRLYAAVEIDGHSLVIVKEPNMSEELDPVSADTGLATDQSGDPGGASDGAAGDGYPIHVGELELPVQFEIDTVALPLAQLSALGPGYVVELPVPVAEAQLKLVAHGQTIGYGELVTVGEHLGIRIIRMAHRHGPVQ
ncbi:YscQ/HrcQ family type III secretion apparatus protein [Trinickia violacea]|uniref:YscQ/HrcQ family type III secretion apparatus protein n=1 Tax=Trinickia violacea TaxID=2571746 RepID=A0A4P8IV49_9BURK|nr:type III secretion system cytoplasmic ring protein SctQ [Trinickia violacea]QCP52296.1 YscQ/HrcQ family type III secretion apparatus protein [Trinickia violacea]